MKDCFDWNIKIHTHTHTELGGRRHERPRMNHSNIVQACNKTNDETFPGLLLVNIELLYPHRG